MENSLRNLQNTNALARGSEWVVHLVQEYVVGDKEYIKNAAHMYRRCRLEMANLRNQVNQTGDMEITAQILNFATSTSKALSLDIM